MKILYVIDAAAAGTSYWVAAAHVRALRQVGVKAELLVVGAALGGSGTGRDDEVRRASVLVEADVLSADAVVAADSGSLQAILRLAPLVCARLVVSHSVGSPPSRRSRRGEATGPGAPRSNEASPESLIVLAASPGLVELLQRDGATPSGAHSCTWARTAAIAPHAGAPSATGIRVLLTPTPNAAWADDASREALAPLRSETPPIELVDLGGAHADTAAARRLSLGELVDAAAGAHIVVGTWGGLAGLDFVALQALAGGCAAVFTDGPSYRDLDPRERASLTVTNGDDQALREAVRTLRDDPALRARLGAAGRRLVASPSIEESGTLLAEILAAAGDRRATLDTWRRGPWPDAVATGPPQGEPDEGNGSDVSRRHQWEVERELARRLRRATRSQRRHLYGLAYDELFHKVPLQPQLAQARDPAARRALVELQLQLVGPFVDASTVLLEIGAGDCAFAREMATRVRRVHAVEASRMEEEPGAGEPPGFHFALADLPPVPVPDGSVDVAYSSHLVEHLHPDDLIPHLEDVLRTLVPGGLYLCVTPNRLLGPHDVSRYFTRRSSGLHLREYTHCELARALRRSGFYPVRAIRRLGERPAPGRLTVVAVVEGFLGLVPSSLRRHLLTRLSTRQEPFRPLEQVKLVAWRPCESR